MKFSILIANYNNGKFFKSCYDSIMMQTYHNWEVIIVDDCSTDNSMEIIKNIIGKDSRFKLYQNEKNCGVGFTKSRLIELAGGYICGFVDPDDALSQDALFSSILAFLGDKIVLTYSKFIKCDENLIPVTDPSLTKQVRNNDLYFFNWPVQIVHFVTFRRDVYEKTQRIDPVLRIAEDQDLYLKLYEKGKVKFIDKVNYYYRMHDGGISQNSNKEKSREYFAKVIFDAMKRRNLQKIYGKAIPLRYHFSSEIYDLLKYKNSVPYRIANSLYLWVSHFFDTLCE